MKVAVTHPYSWPEVRRGAERIIVETARALAGRGHAVTVFTAGASSGRTREDGYRIVRFHRLFSDALRHERWFAWRVLPALVAGRFDVVHSLMPHDAVAAIRTRRVTGHRVVYEELGNPMRSWWETLPDRQARLRVVRDADVYGCMSQYALDVLAADHQREGTLIPGGVRLDRFRPAPIRAEHPTILFSGTLSEPRKGVGLLLEALALLAEVEPAVELWLSGPGDAAPWLAQAPPRARERTTVLPLGDPHDQSDRYGRAWVTALPSKGDSFGLVLVESLACGTPIVALEHAAPPELVTDDIGAVSKPDDPAALAAALASALALARKRETAARCRAAAEPYDWDTGLVPRLEAAYGSRSAPPGA